MSVSKPKADPKIVAANKKTERIKAIRDFVVSTVHAQGKWAKVGSINVMCVKDHCGVSGLNIRYYTPFQKRRSPANAGKQLRYQLEAWKRSTLYLSIMWNEGGPIYVETYYPSKLDEHLLPPAVSKKATDTPQQMAVAS